MNNALAVSDSVSDCGLISYGKYRYEQHKREKRENVRTKRAKEVRFRSSIDEHDLNVKVNNIRRMLTHGNKVKMVVRDCRSGSYIVATILNKLKDLARVDEKEEIERDLIICISKK